MARRSPLHNAVPETVSVCGKLLSAGQSVLVAESAVGQRERAKAAKGQIQIRPSNKKGMVQIVCTLSK